MLKVIRNWSPLWVCFALVAGCGGSSGGGTAAAPAPTGNDPGAGLATITTDNALTVAGVAVEATLQDDLLGSLMTQGVPIASGNSVPMALLGKITSTTQQVLYATSGQQAVPCLVSGSVSISIDISNPLALTPGDEFALVFEACDDGDGAVVNGALVMIVVSFEGDLLAEDFRLGTTLEVSAFQVTEDGETTEASATIDLALDKSPTFTTITLSTSTFTSSRAGMTETLTNLSITVSEDESMFPTAITVETSARVSSPDIGGDVIVRTRVALQRMGDEYPFVGELEIMAANNAVIIVIALDSDTVRLEIDVDGDGSLDDTIDTTWDELTDRAPAA